MHGTREFVDDGGRGRRHEIGQELTGGGIGWFK